MLGEWKTVNGWKELPIGLWIARHDTDIEHMKYSVADNRGNLCFCGNAFAFDLPKIIAYTGIPLYELPTEQS